MANTVLRNTIGARNPYAVAELKLGKKINWDKKSQEEKIKILEKAFGRPYDKLFDPLYGSSLFPSSQKQPSELPKTGAGDTVSCTPNPCPAMDAWLPVPGGSFIDTSISYEDLIQGCLPDCYFIAALSALAWASLSQKEFRDNLTSSPYSYQFWSPQIDAQGNIMIDGTPVADPAFTVNDKIPLIQPATKIYSRSNTQSETWPCIYEKAYATWCDCKKKQIPPGPDVNPDYLSVCQGNPLTALIHLKGKKCKAFVTNSLNDGDCYLKIGKQYQNTISLKTNYPTVAWTYPSAPAGVSYSDDVIVANHSYTVLGVYPQVIPANDKKYIVMRNPFGQKSGDPKRGVDPNLPADAFFDGVWLPLGKDAAGSYRRLNDPLDGIFALKDSVFKKYFAGFGWAIY